MCRLSICSLFLVSNCLLELIELSFLARGLRRSFANLQKILFQSALAGTVSLVFRDLDVRRGFQALPIKSSKRASLARDISLKVNFRHAAAGLCSATPYDPKMFLGQFFSGY